MVNGFRNTICFSRSIGLFDGMIKPTNKLIFDIPVIH